MGVKKKSGNVQLASESKGYYTDSVVYVAVNKSSEISHSIQKQVSKSQQVNSKLFTSFLITLKNVFLPHGYPNSVSPDYLSYQLYDTIQAFCSSLTGALATEAVMKGVGVGDAASTPLAAALTWLLKSGTGMVGQILFTWGQGTKLDMDCKKWRFFADVVNDTAIFVDLISPLIPTQFRLGVFCLSSLGRSLVGVAGGATRAAITQHQSRDNNMADVSAKDGSQETLVNLVALITSLIMLPLVSGVTWLVWTLYITFTAGHLLANYLALKSLQFESLNEPRLLICLQEFLSQNSVPSIQKVNELESVIVGFGIKDTNVTHSGYQVKMGVSVSTLLKSADQFSDLVDRSSGSRYLIDMDTTTKVVNVVLAEDTKPWDLIEAYSRSTFLTYHIATESKAHPWNDFCTRKWNCFEKALKSSGFATDRALLSTSEWRADWISKLD